MLTSALHYRGITAREAASLTDGKGKNKTLTHMLSAIDIQERWE